MPSTATRLVLVRHASTIWNRDNRYQGQSDVPLDETGRQEARQLAPRLAELAPASAYTSDLVRCRETVELALSHQPVPIFIDPRLREAHYGQWEGMTREEIQKRYPGLWQQRKKDPTMAAPPGGEPLVVMQRRVMASVQEIAQRHLGQTVLVCTHAGPIRAALCGLLGIDLRRSWQFRTDNASLTVVAITEEGAVIEAFNDTRHLSGSYPDSLVP